MADADPHILAAAQSLDSLGKGQSARILAIRGDDATDPVTRRLFELGFEEGNMVELTHVGPIGANPLSVRVGTMTVALRRAEASRILVQL